MNSLRRSLIILILASPFTTPLVTAAAEHPGYIEAPEENYRYWEILYGTRDLICHGSSCGRLVKQAGTHPGRNARCCGGKYEPGA